MTEEEQLILDGVLRNEPFICCHDGYAYFLGPDSYASLTWQDAIAWCKSLGDDYELASIEIIAECYQNERIRTEFGATWYWSSTIHERHHNSAWSLHIATGGQNYLDILINLCNARAVRKIKI